MSQHDMDVANSVGATVRSDINSALQALASNSSGSSAPSTTYAYQYWVDTTNAVLKQRNAANSAWIVRATLAETLVVARSSNTILALTDFSRSFIATSSFTQTLTAAATLGDGWWCQYKNDGTGTITLDPNSSETVNGATTLDIPPGHGGILRCNGTGFYFDMAPSMDKGQIKFPATQNASSDANTLDDWERGSFTATVASGSISAQNCRYVKAGSAVMIRGSVTFGGTTQAPDLGGLPFTSANTGDTAVAVYCSGIDSATGTAPMGLIVKNSTTISMYGFQVNSITSLQQSGGDLAFGGTYFV